MAEYSVDPISRTPKAHPKVSILTLDAGSLLPQLSRPITRNCSEFPRSKLPFQRAYKPLDEPGDHMEALSIQTSQPTLTSTTQFFSVRDKPYSRSPLHVDKVTIQARGKPGTAQITHTANSFLAISSTDSDDSNELNLDLAKFIRTPTKRSVNVKEITVEEVFARRLRAQMSPLTHLKDWKRKERVSYSPATVARTAVTRSLLQTLNKPRGRVGTGEDKGLELRGLRAYRVIEEPNLQ